MLLAKTNPRVGLRDHTMAVRQAVDTILRSAGEDLLRFVGLDPSHYHRLRRLCLVAALLHDLGKLGSHFQLYIAGNPPDFHAHPQAARHEYVSALVAQDPDFQRWIRREPLFLQDVDWYMVMFAVIGHHRKPFRCEARPTGRPLVLDLGHPEVQEILATTGLDRPPTHRILLPTGNGDVGDDLVTRLNAIQAEYRQHIGLESSRTNARLLQVIKAVLVSADVLGSVALLPNSPVIRSVGQSLKDLPGQDYYARLLDRHLSRARDHDPDFAPKPFQVAAGNAGTVSFCPAGCGSGKSLAQARWALTHAPGRRLYVCFPSTGTATESFRDHLFGEPDSDLAHMRAAADKAAIAREKLASPADPRWTFTTDDWYLDDTPNPPVSAAERREKAELQRIAWEEDAEFALGLLFRKSVYCTADTVLGILGNQRRGIYAFPAIAQGAFVFDEIHNYDPTLWATLLHFVRLVHAPILLMTGSLPQERLRQLESAQPQLEVLVGDHHHENLPRYLRTHGDPRSAARDALRRGLKVLWIVNTVDQAISLYEELHDLQPTCLHSHFRPPDREANQRRIIDAFRRPGPALAVTTQIAEMSLDISADLLVTQISPIHALIQRMGRLARFLRPGQPPGRFLVWDPPTEHVLPYATAEIETAREWLAALPTRTLSQRDLLDPWEDFPSHEEPASLPWLLNAMSTVPQPIRETRNPKISVLLDEADLPRRSAELQLRSIPMSYPPGKWEWWLWTSVRHHKVAPQHRITYNQERGGKWTND